MSEDEERPEPCWTARSQPIGYGDLVEVFAAIREQEHDIAARMLGFGSRPASLLTARRVGEPGGETIGEVEPPPPPKEPPPLDPNSAVALWRAVEVEYQFAWDETPKVVLSPSDPNEVLGLEDIGRFSREEQARARAGLRRIPIVPWSHLRRRLERVFRVLRPSSCVDVEALVEVSSRAEAFSRIPRVERRTQAGRLVVVLDCAPRLVPFREDICEVCQRVVAQVGRPNLEVLVWEGGPPSWADEQDVLAVVDEALRPGDVVFGMSDLGIYGRRDGHEDEAGWLGPTSRRWLRLGRALERAGVHRVALLPCPAHRWPRELARAWDCIDWEAPVSGLGGGLAGVEVQEASTWGTPLERLVALLSLCVTVEPPLLRGLRTLVLGADLGTEADAWNLVEVSSDRWDASLGPGLRREGEARLVAMLGDSEARAWVKEGIKLIKRHHRLRPREIWYEEVIRILSADLAATKASETELEVELLEDGSDVEAAVRFVRRLRNSLEHPEQWLSLEQGVDLDGWLRRAFSGPARRVSALSKDHPEFGTDMRRAVQLALERRPASERGQPAPPGYGSRDSIPDGQLRRWSLFQRGGALVVGVVEIRRGSRVLELEGYSDGIEVEGALIHVDAHQEASWLLPELGESLAVQTTGQRVVLERLRRPSWADAVGRDEFGLWASFLIEGEAGEVEQRMRWIPPGRDAEGESDVRLTEGFWLAETPCTQALWSAVMGDNPSYFDGPTRPVECVSVERIREFIKELRRRLPEAGFDLPTDAQWERGHNARGSSEVRLEDVAWFGGDAFEVGVDAERKVLTRRKNGNVLVRGALGTRDVALKRANVWGLFDMLGNVFEVCVAEGTGEAGSHVGLGGGWKSPAEHLSPTTPVPVTPESALSDLGFRLSAQEWVRPVWAEAAERDRYGAWASFRVGKVEVRLRWIPPGSFLMGSPRAEEGRWEDEGPQHEVRLTEGFWMAETPCTQALWVTLMGENPSHFEGENLPVEQVSWEGVQRFFVALNARNGPGWGLPTEAQWEYACRAGTRALRYGGLDGIAWYAGNSGGQTHDVRGKAPNAWGLYDMLGNVYEWCSDRKSSYQPDMLIDPRGPTSGQNRVFRGGGWGGTARRVRAAYRDWGEPGGRLSILGFRLVRGQGLRQTSERSESKQRSETSKGRQARGGGSTGGRPASSPVEGDQ